MADISAVKEITAKLENGVKDLFESDKYAAYLQTMSRFHRYSTRNTLLIHMQMPDATRVAGFNDWKNNFKRQVKKGEHGIRILAPIPFVKTQDMEKIDPETQRPIIGEDGQPIREEIEIRLARFKVVPVFDVSQTIGEPLPVLAETLTGDVSRYELFMDSLRAVSPLPIRFEDLTPDTDGICRFGDGIAIRNGMSEIQTVSAVIHEITHAKLHDLQIVKDNGDEPKDRRTEEVEAESVSYAVCQYYGVDTGANSFGYLAEWSKTRELKELNASLDVIRKTAAELIDSIDEQYRALAKERGIDLTIAAVQLEGQLDLSNVVPEIVANDLIASYARNAEVSDPRAVGSTVLMTPVFDDGNFNRTGKKIRVTVEEPAGKYQLFSRDEFDTKAFYFLTASGMIDHTSEYFRDEWNEETRKWEKHRPTETEFDEVIAKIAEQFELDLANPAKWTKYQHAAVVNRLDDCEAHNVPVRAAREAESQARHEAAERERHEEQRQAQEKYEARIDEIADAMKNGKTISVGYNENEFDGKNPMLDLFKRYGIDLPLRTQGWVNTGLAEITDGSYRYYKSKHKGDSSTFSTYLIKLRDAIRQEQIEQAQGDRSNSNFTVKEEKIRVENNLYDKLAGMFPDFMDGKYSYMRLESSGFEPLLLEWIGGNRISVMHTYTMNGDLMYDPMITFDVDREVRKMTAAEFEQSMPPLYQRVDEYGNGASIDGNGNERSIRGLRLQINDFAAQWFQNIIEQGYLPVKANLVRGEDDEVRITFDKDGKPIMPETDKPQDVELDILMPDPTIGLSEMNLYGYSYDGMLPLTAERALELFDANNTVYLLYSENTEAMALERGDIERHDGIFGIERGDWEISPVRAARMALVANAEGSREADLLYGNQSKFGIYQIKDGIDEARDFRFTPMRELEAHGLSVDRVNYELVYTGNLDFLDTLTNLNKIYQDFNINHPADYAARSVSVSDVIVLQVRGEVSAHFVDSVGFKELPSFTGNEREQTPIQAAETHSQLGNSSGQPTVAALRAEVERGGVISLMDLSRAVKAEQKPPMAKGKPSLLDKLEQNKHRASQQGQSDARKPNGLEV